MKTSSYFTTTSLVPLLIALSPLACGGAEMEPSGPGQTAALSESASAQAPAPEAAAPAQDGRPGPGHHRRSGPGAHHKGPPTPEKLIERFDANENGTLETDEVPERMREHVGQIDKNGDGAISKEELGERFKARFAERAKARFERKDLNRDGVLDQNELGAERWARLSVADQNGDQKLTPEELKAAFEAGKLGPMHPRGPAGRGGAER